QDAFPEVGSLTYPSSTAIEAKAKGLPEMNALVLALLIALALPFSTPRQADAQEVFTAVAVVNDEVISRLDFEARLRIALLASGLPDTPETINQISGPVLRQLIDERLQRQEAKRLSIEVTEEEMDRGLTEMAQRDRKSTRLNSSHV